MSKTKPQGLIIEIFESVVNEGYAYNLYETLTEQENGESYDGGLCTGSLKDTLEMATSQARF